MSFPYGPASSGADIATLVTALVATVLTLGPTLLLATCV
jgi:hypothetical protein